jgi:hypothetical protein
MKPRRPACAKEGSVKTLPSLDSPAQSSAFCTTSLPLYVPHSGQTRWERLNAPQLLHFSIVGGVSFQTLERRLSRLALETFRFGTAMFYTTLV